MPTVVSTFDPGTECKLVAARFHNVIAELRQAGVAGDNDPGIVPDNFVILLPFALTEVLPVKGGLEAARGMAVGNAFGAAHFLSQDRLLDSEHDLTPDSCLMSDGSLLAFWREYARLIPASSTFWNQLSSYLTEYFASLDWEQRVLRTERGKDAVSDTSIDATLRQLGLRMAPLKVTAAAVAHLSGRKNMLDPAERMIEDFHAGYQLLDDLQDLDADLTAKRYSVVAWMLADADGIDLLSTGVTSLDLLRGGARSGALDRLAELAQSRFHSAADRAAELESDLLATYLLGHADRARKTIGRLSSRLAIVARTQQPTPPHSTGTFSAEGAARLHAFSVKGQGFAYDRVSGLFFEADGQTVDLIDWLGRGGDPSELSVLRMNHGESSLSEALAELSVLGDAVPLTTMLPASARNTRRASCEVVGQHEPPAPCLTLSPIVSLGLNVSGACNLACDYCYLGSRTSADGARMSERTATRALDLLFTESFAERDLSLVFFGGEPLLNLGLVETLAGRAAERAKSEKRSLSLHMTTNGTLLTADVHERLRRGGISVMVSIDGDAQQHDAHRVFRDGRGSYDAVAANVRAIRRAAADSAQADRLSARATITEETGHLPDVVSHLRELGFSTVHLSPVSGRPMGRGFIRKVLRGFEQLAVSELEGLLAGQPPAVGNFTEAVVSLELGRRRLSPCGAGTRYISVSHDGCLYLCHRFSGDLRYRVGDVEEGLNRRVVAAMLGRLARPSSCDRCWALGLCGGPCFHEVSSVCPADEGACASGRSAERASSCFLTRRILELSMWIYASLPSAHRERLASRAWRRLRPPVNLV